MKILHYDCFAGISGDMNLAALIDLGVDKNALVAELEKLGLRGWRLETSRDERGGIFGTRVDVVCEDARHHHEHSHVEHGHAHHHEHRSFADIKKIISSSALSEKSKALSLDIFTLLAKAEGEVHGKDADEVHFHEVGALDSIIDIVGAAVCAELLGAEKFTSSAVELGGGTVKCQHGILPVPAPATAIIAKAFPAKLGGTSFESTTPTGAAIIAALCSGFEEKLSGKILKAGVGIGHKKGAELPNILRVMLIESGEENSGIQSETLSEFSANIDDMTAEHLAHLAEKLFDAGALDVWQEPITMKKGRLGTKVCALAKPEDAAEVRECFFKNSSTLGLREASVRRHFLRRESVVKKTSFGEVRFKSVEFGGVKRAKPEFEDCRKTAEASGLSIADAAEKLRNEFENPKA